MLFSTGYMHHAYNYSHNQNVIRVFLFIYVFNNFVKLYGYCIVNFLKVPIFKTTLVSILFLIHNLLVLSHYCNFIKEFNSLLYLSMPIDNGIWQARVGIFFALKLVLKWKSKTREFPFLQNPVYFSLMLIFNFGKFLLNNAYHAYKCMLTEKNLISIQ